jgi:hypothetical protein
MKPLLNALVDLKLPLVQRLKIFTSKFVQSVIPFFTGKQKLIDTAGRIDKFNRKFKKALDKKKDTQEEPATATS